LDLRVLGPVEVVVDGAPLALGARKQRAVLAMLVLEANRPVSADRLVEGLWGESPPASAGKMLQLYISQLRKALTGTGAAIETRGRAYQLSCAAESVDLARAERLVASAGREAPLNGDAREALALWRGPALADVADEPFAAAEIRRCEELWLQAKELAIDADLAGGRHEDALREVAPLAAEYPLREHVQGQLMLALYRSGRQAEALDAFRVARGRLVDEIGSEPGPELRRLHDAILHQDPALDAPARQRSVAARMPPVRRTGRRALLVAGGLLACVAIGAVAVRHWTAGQPVVAVEADSVARIDPATGAARAAYGVGHSPSAVAAGAGSVWVANALDQTVTRILRAHDDQAIVIPIGARPGALAFGEGSLWVAADDQRVAQVNPATNRVVRRFDVGGQPSAIAVGFGSVWVAEPREGVVARIEIARGATTQRLPAGAGPTALAVGAGAVWVAAEQSGQLVRLDPRSGTATASTNVGNGPSSVAVGAGAVWVANRADGTISRVDPRRGSMAATYPIGGDPAALAVEGGKVWIADAATGAIARFNPDTGRVDARRSLASSPSALVAADGSLWATAVAARSSHRGGRLVAHSSYCQEECMDPAGGYAQGWETLSLVYDGLLGYRRLPGAAGEALSGALATARPEPRDDGHTYLFTLRPGVRFSDGRPVRPADVRGSIERAVLMSGETYPGWFANIVGARGCERRTTCDLSRGILTDDRARTVVFRLRHPDPAFPYRVASVLASVVPVGTPAHATLPPPPGTGPYRFASLDARGNARLVRNPYFRSWSAAARPDGFADEIVVRRANTPQIGIDAVERGSSDLARLDYAGRLFPPARRSGIATRYPSRVVVAPRLATDFMFLNVREPPFDRVLVRRAVNLATDRAHMVQLADGSSVAQPACQVIPPSVPRARPYCPYTAAPTRTGDWTAPDVTAAKRLVEASGTRGMRVRVWTDTTKVRYGNYFVRLLHELGYRTTLRVVDVGLDYFGAVGDPRNHAQIGMSGWVADYPTAATFFDPSFSCAGLRAPSSLNLSRLCSPSLDRKVAVALRADGPAADEAWAQAARALSDLAPAVPLATRQSTFFTSARAGNVQVNPMLGVMLDHVWVR
jgi:peptide/nickel transport system substrate-binding protein